MNFFYKFIFELLKHMEFMKFMEPDLPLIHYKYKFLNNFYFFISAFSFSLCHTVTSYFGMIKCMVPGIPYQWREIVTCSLSFSLKLGFPHPQLLWGFQRFIVREDVNVTLTFYYTLLYFWDIENENIKLFHRPIFLNT